MKVDPSVETYQVGGHFKALIKAILVPLYKILENFFPFQVSQPLCVAFFVLNFWSKFEQNRYHSPAGELEMQKNLSKDFKGATRMALMRALR